MGRAQQLQEKMLTLQKNVEEQAKWDEKARRQQKSHLKKKLIAIQNKKDQQNEMKRALTRL